MSIVYKDELDMINGKSIISDRVDFDVELYIYVQKLMKEKGKTFNEIINDLIREYAENNLCKKVEYAPYTQSTTVRETSFPGSSNYVASPSNPYPYWTAAYTNDDNISGKSTSD